MAGMKFPSGTGAFRYIGSSCRCNVCESSESLDHTMETLRLKLVERRDILNTIIDSIERLQTV